MLVGTKGQERIITLSVQRNERVKEVARIPFVFVFVFFIKTEPNRNRHQNVCYRALIVVFNVVTVN